MEIISGLVAAPLQPTAASVTAPPDAAATQRFAALMRPPEAEAAATLAGAAAIAPSAGAYAIDAAKGPGSVGDRILNGMQDVSDEFRATWTQVSGMLRAGSPELDMTAALKLQVHLAQASLQYEMVGKAVSRSTQNFDQLVRVQ
ncbi:MAG: EscI/YscI/HrpB family type III secretion system inner rod protein [Comamonas sp.]